MRTSLRLEPKRGGDREGRGFSTDPYAFLGDHPRPGDPVVHPSPWDHELPSQEVTAVLLSSLGKLAAHVGALCVQEPFGNACSLSGQDMRGAGHRNLGLSGLQRLFIWRKLDIPGPFEGHVQQLLAHRHLERKPISGGGTPGTELSLSNSAQCSGPGCG